MKIKILAAGAAAVAALSLSSAGNASTLTLSGCTTTNGTITCTQSDDTISFNQTHVAGAFSSTVNFGNSLGGLYEIVLESTSRGFSFSSVSVDGTTIWTGTGHILDLFQHIDAGIGQNVTFTGHVPAGADTGSLSFEIADVPEPATWAMMLLGFGAIGFSMRRRSRQTLPQLA